MKNKLAIFVALMMVMCFTFAACGGNDGGGSSGGNEGADLSDSKYVGTWTASSLSMGDESENVDNGGMAVLTLNADGTGKLVSTEEGGEEESSEFTWELTSDGFKTKGDTKLTFTDDGDGIKTKIFGADLHFVRAAEGSESAAEGSSADSGAAGYAGSDPVEAAVFKHLVEKVAPSYTLPDGAVTIPVMQIIEVDKDDDDGDVDVLGVFWVDNYVVEGDTLKCVSGGEHDGKMELKKDGDGYIVEEFEEVKDGDQYNSSAKDIFEEKYEEFTKVVADTDARNKLRTETVAAYVKANGLNVTKYQDEGWDPVELSL